MTFEQLNKIIKENNIPENVHLLSDSGWECDATEMDGVYYNKKKNVIVFTQECTILSKYDPDNDWIWKKRGYIRLSEAK